MKKLFLLFVLFLGLTAFTGGGFLPEPTPSPINRSHPSGEGIELRGRRSAAADDLHGGTTNDFNIDYTKYVNPFVGTGGHGHTFPGATVPFGMVQPSPDTRLEGWDGCSGYHYSDSVIWGFSHTHLSGTGVPDYCDILFMPFVEAKNIDLDKNVTGYYASQFDHGEESAEPGYYSVMLKEET